MFVKAASLFALMGAGALAHPAKRDVVYQTDVVVDTVVVATKTEFVSPGSIQTPAPQAVVPQVKAPAPAPEPAAAPSPAPAKALALPSLSLPSLPLPSSGSSDEPDYMSVVNKYRGLMGLSTLSFNQDLQNGIQQTVNDGNGQMVHAFNDHATGQVLAPAPQNDFFQAFVQGWLCEVPLAAYAASCGSGKYNLENQTGHYDILSRSDITECGCAWADGIWGCDVA